MIDVYYTLQPPRMEEQPSDRQPASRLISYKGVAVYARPYDGQSAGKLQRFAAPIRLIFCGPIYSLALLFSCFGRGDCMERNGEGYTGYVFEISLPLA